MLCQSYSHSVAIMLIFCRYSITIHFLAKADGTVAGGRHPGHQAASGCQPTIGASSWSEESREKKSGRRMGKGPTAGRQVRAGAADFPALMVPASMRDRFSGRTQKRSVMGMLGIAQLGESRAAWSAEPGKMSELKVGNLNPGRSEEWMI